MATAQDGTLLYYRVEGFGRPVVLLDGLGCAGFAWRYLAPELAASYSVIRLNYRGHGRSGPPVDSAEVGVSALAQDVADVLDGLSIRRAAFVGHSLGTQVALEFYRAHPMRAESLVLMCGSYGKVTSTFHGKDFLHQILPGLLAAVQKYPQLAHAAWSSLPSGLAYRIAKLAREVDGDSLREEDFRAYWDHVCAMDPDVFLRMLHLAGEHSAEDWLSEVRVPTLVIVAERDTFTPSALALQMADAIPSAERLFLKGASHAAPVEQPRVIYEAIRDFLERNIPPEAGDMAR